MHTIGYVAMDKDRKQGSTWWCYKKILD